VTAMYRSVRVLGWLWLIAAVGCVSDANTAATIGQDASKVWFGDVRRPLAVGSEAERALVRYVATRVFNAESLAAGLPPALREDMLPRAVLISISDGASPARVLVGSGRGIAAAVEEALARLRARGDVPSAAKWMKLDVVQQTHPLSIDEIHSPLRRDPGLYGIAFGRTPGVALLADELVVRRLVDDGRRLDWRKIRSYLAARGDGDRRYEDLLFRGLDEAHRFTTLSYFSDGKAVVRCDRGGRAAGALSRRELLSSAAAAAGYLARCVGPDGRFLYEHDPTTGQVSKDYNILRHAGAVYGMLEVYEVTRDPKLLASAKRAIVYLTGCVKPARDVPGAMCVLDGDFVKLGGNATAVLALAKYTRVTGDRRHLPLMRALALWIRSVQEDSGRFPIHAQSYRSGTVLSDSSPFYPGEAALATARLHPLDPAGGWDKVAAKAVHYLVTVRDRRSAPPDQWLLYALDEVYRFQPRKLQLDHSLRVARGIMQAQNTDRDPPDWTGSFHRPPHSCSAATRMEALAAACRLVRDFGNAEEARRIRERLELGVRFLFQMQLGPESAMHLDDPASALGGVRESFTNYEIRIDYVQHFLSAVLGLRRILEKDAASLRRETMPPTSLTLTDYWRAGGAVRSQSKRCRNGQPREWFWHSPHVIPAP